MSGCSTGMINLTPGKIPVNSSGIYTFSLRVKPSEAKIDKESIKANIVIDGETHRMVKSNLGEYIFEYEHLIPGNRASAKYYYELVYNFKTKVVKRHERKKTKLFAVKLIDRYVIQLESDRGVQGSKVAVLGRGFNPEDRIVFDDTEISTEFQSPNSISFIVPGVPANVDYNVSLRSYHNDDILIGDFRVDSSKIGISPNKISLLSGQVETLNFNIDFEAPAGGLIINVTTDIPQSVIMPEVLIPEGEKSVNVPLEGGEKGEGYIFVESSGFSLVEVPVIID